MTYFACIATASLTATPQPVWPTEFTTNFSSPAKRTSGVWAFSSSQASEIIVLGDGTRDHLCSGYHNDTACTQLINGGWRYLVWPQINACCRCCSSATGCGVLRNDWLSNTSGNLHYVGIVEVRATSSGSSRRCHKWNVVGLPPAHPNYWMQSVADGTPCEFDGYNYLRDPSEPADDQYIVVLSTYTPGAVDPSLFAVPHVCNGAAACGAPVCDTP
jgi:hypothetical protein